MMNEFTKSVSESWVFKIFHDQVNTRLKVLCITNH